MYIGFYSHASAFCRYIGVDDFVAVAALMENCVMFHEVITKEA